MTISKKEDRTIYMLTVVMLFAWMGTDMYLPVLPNITLFYKTSNILSGLTLGIFIFMAATIGLFAGNISDHFGRKKTLQTANVIYVISTLLIPFGWDIHIVIFLRAVEGIGAGIFSVVLRQVVMDILPPNKQVAASSIMSTAFVVSPAIAPIIGAFIGTHYDWQGCFFFLAFLQIVSFCLIKFYFEDPKIKKEKITSLKKIAGNYLIFIMTKRFNVLVILALLSYAPYVMFLTVSSFIFIDILKVSKFLYSLVFILLVVTFIISSRYLKHLKDLQISDNKIFSIGNYLALGGSLILGLALLFNDNYIVAAIIVVAMMIIRSSIALIIPLSGLRSMEIFKRNRGQAFGLYVFIQYSLAALTGYIATFFHNYIVAMFIISVIISLLSIFTLFLGSRNLGLPNYKRKLLKISATK